MSIRAVFLEDGSVIEHHGGKSGFKALVKCARINAFMTNGKLARVWFRDCPEWRKAYSEEFARWRSIKK